MYLHISNDTHIQMTIQICAAYKHIRSDLYIHNAHMICTIHTHTHIQTHTHTHTHTHTQTHTQTHMHSGFPYPLLSLIKFQSPTVKLRNKYNLIIIPKQKD